VGRLIRSVVGRVPSVWPIFPVAGSPNWSVEGLATHYESRLTGAGRIPASVHDMIVRTAALEDRIPDLDELSAPSPVWPAGQRDYTYGSRLMRHIADRYGDGAPARIVEATAGSLPPTFLFFDHVARSAVGEPFDALYQEWRTTARDSALAVLRRVEAAGRTKAGTVVARGPFTGSPRVSPDGQKLSFAVQDYRSDPATALVDLGTGRERMLARRNQFGTLLGPAAWLPDGRALVVAQLQLDGPYRAFSDLWRVELDGRERRLTRGRRLAQPDVAPDGRRVAAVQNDHGAIRLVIHDLETGRTRVLAEAAPGQAFDSPRWDPRGDRVAAGRFADGRVDLVLVDASTGAVTPVTDDDALDLAPAWSPDGRWLLWWSDRTGVPNLMAVRADALEAGDRGPVLQVTNVATGAFDPEVAPDGSALYFAAYHHDGWHLERMPFDPSAWAPAPASVMEHRVALLPPPPSVGSHGAVDSTHAPTPGAVADSGAPAPRPGPARPYSALPTVRPYYWLPTLETIPDGRGLTFVGVFTAGADVLRRHVWHAATAVDVQTGRLEADGVWTYRGWGSPELSVRASRDWWSAGVVDRGDGTVEPILGRTGEASLSTIFWRRRWRSTAWLRATADVEARSYEGRDLDPARLTDLGVTLPDVPTVAGLDVSPGWTNARRHAFSISLEDGVTAVVGAGRWWGIDDGTHAYDQATGRVSGYLGLPVWGFADHVLAARVAGFVREGDRARLRSIGGIPGSPASLLVTTVSGGANFPVRGFSEGTRVGTRGWTASAEYRFPIHMRGAPGHVLGLSLTSLAGTVFADAGSAWCAAEDRARLGPEVCPAAGEAPLISAGAELSVDLGAFHQVPILVRIGAAARLQGPSDGAAAYVSFGPAF
ncbi:MAG: hypothetical protein GWM90_07020, partial [Gemmatimonadetes bacterium]|nr:hypothetical protein [Gemmatimonadota bacterium]NIX43866.1 hypothetical protein [Gemmatimonadota bacterium]